MSLLSVPLAMLHLLTLETLHSSGSHTATFSQFSSCSLLGCFSLISDVGSCPSSYLTSTCWKTFQLRSAPLPFSPSTEGKPSSSESPNGPHLLSTQQQPRLLSWDLVSWHLHVSAVMPLRWSQTEPAPQTHSPHTVLLAPFTSNINDRFITHIQRHLPLICLTCSRPITDGCALRPLRDSLELLSLSLLPQGQSQASHLYVCNRLNDPHLRSSFLSKHSPHSRHSTFWKHASNHVTTPFKIILGLSVICWISYHLILCPGMEGKGRDVPSLLTLFLSSNKKYSIKKERGNGGARGLECWKAVCSVAWLQGGRRGLWGATPCITPRSHCRPC